MNAVCDPAVNIPLMKVSVVVVIYSLCHEHSERNVD